MALFLSGTLFLDNKFAQLLAFYEISEFLHGCFVTHIPCMLQLVNISEYHVQQMQENAPSLYPESDDDSQSSEDRHFAAAVAMIYHSKVRQESNQLKGDNDCIHFGQK